MPSNHSSSVIPFSSYLQSFPASGSFPMSWFFTSGSPSSGASPLASVLPMYIQSWFPLGFGLIFLQSKGLLSLLQHHSSKASVLQHSLFYGPALSDTVGMVSVRLFLLFTLATPSCLGTRAEKTYYCVDPGSWFVDRWRGLTEEHGGRRCWWKKEYLIQTG